MNPCARLGFISAQMELDEDEDEAVIDWLYESAKPLLHSKFVNGPSYRKWSLPLPVMANLRSDMLQ